MRSIFFTGVVVSLAGIGCASHHAANQETAQAQLPLCPQAQAQAQHPSSLPPRPQAQAQAPRPSSQAIIITFTPKGGATEQQMSERERALRESGVGEVRHTQNSVILTVNGGVLFAFDKDTLLPAAKTGLDKVAKVITETQPTEPLRVEGYTDNIGSAEYNQGLSERRAVAVSQYLISRGVKPDQISTEGLGESNPVATNETAEGRANNRRVEIVMPEPQLGVGGAGQAGEQHQGGQQQSEQQKSEQQKSEQQKSEQQQTERHQTEQQKTEQQETEQHQSEHFEQHEQQQSPPQE